MTYKSIGYEIKKIDNLMERKIMDNLKKDKSCYFSLLHGKILKYLFDNYNRDIYQRDIEKHFVLRRSTISGILKTMEKNNMIVRSNSINDKRLKKISLTSEAINQKQQMDNKIASFEQLLQNNISKEELNVFFEVMDKIKNNLRNEDNK